MNKKGIDELKREYEEVPMSNGLDGYKDAIRRAKEDNRSRRRKVVRAWKIAASSAAAVVIAFIILPNVSPRAAHAMGKIPVIGTVVKAVTFRDYRYEGETQIADIEVPKLVTADITGEEEEAAYGGETTSPINYTLQESVDEINGEIQELTQRIIEDFQADVEQREGCEEVVVSHEVICSTEQYFTLKLMHYEGTGSGTQWNYYYTIDLTTGERMELKDLFTEDEDYIGIISDEIKKQMKERMENDEEQYYWLNDEIEELNFKEITPDTQFYINENSNVVIIFNEGEVAPAYMGVVSFEIPAEILQDIRK